MAPVGKGKDLINHGLHPDFNRPYSIFFEQGESLFIQSIRSSGDADGIDQTGSDERLNFFQITNLIIPMDGCKTSPVKSNLSFPGFLIVRNLAQRGFNKVTNGRGRREPFARSHLVAEETAVTAPQIWKKDRKDQRIRAHITFNFRFQISKLRI
jgi:hypothetical protein